MYSLNKISISVLINFILIFIVYINSLPNNFFFASGDFEQVIDLNYFFNNYNKSFTNDFPGQFNHLTPHLIYYFPLLIISKFISLSINFISNYFNFIFIIFSYWSCYFSLKIFFPKLDEKVVFILSFLYIFNFVFYLAYWYTWVFSPYFLFYILFPFNLGIFYKFVLKSNSIDRKWFYELFFISPIIFFNNIPFANLAFYIVLLNCFFIFTVSFLFFKIINNKKFDYLIIIKAFLFIFIFSVINSWSIFPPISNFLIILKSVTDGSYSFASLGWIFSQALSLNNLFSLGGLEQFKNLKLSYLYSLIMPLFVIFIIFKIKFNILNKTIFIFFLINMFIMNKGLFILPKELIEILFVDTFLYAFRSSDKSLITIPFIIILIISSFLVEKKTANQIYISSLVLLVSILSFYPIFTGGLKKTNDLLFDKGENYLTSQRSMIHEIPQTYINLKKFINENITEANILALPYSESPSMGWIYIDKQGYIGTDYTRQAISKDIFRLENIFIDGTNIGSIWNNSDKNDLFILNILRIFPTNYLLYHKDYMKSTNEKTIKLINYLHEQDQIKLLYENEDINFYELSLSNKNNNFFSFPKKVTSYNYNGSIIKEILNKEILNLNENQFILGKNSFHKNHPVDDILSNKYSQLEKIKRIEEYRKNEIKYLFKKLNSSNYNLSLFEYNQKKLFITFHKSFHKNWNIECKNFECSKTHYNVLGYANGWQIDLNSQIPKKLEFEITFATQKHIEIFMFVSIFFSLLTLFTFLFRNKIV